MFVASVVYTQDWELGSPNLIPAQLLACCMPLDNLLSASVSAGFQPSPQNHADLCKTREDEVIITCIQILKY